MQGGIHLFHEELIMFQAQTHCALSTASPVSLDGDSSFTVALMVTHGLYSIWSVVTTTEVTSYWTCLWVPLSNADFLLESALIKEVKMCLCVNIWWQEGAQADTSHIAGKSTHNQRIERLWRDVFRCVLSTFHSLFYFMEELGCLDPVSDFDLFVLHAVFLPKVGHCLKEFVHSWNCQNTIGRQEKFG